MSAPEALLDRLGRAVGNALQASGPDDGAAWAELAGLGLFGLGVPVELGGLGLGERAAAAACRALGRELEQAGCRDTLLAVDCLVAAGVEPRPGLLADLVAGRLRCRALAWPGGG
ncbi:MAG TPA: acyl-CoA dehydrogenase family protein, partial [Candidatus Eisenbacteria bacterium]|nr:acyl-CoA dehydrogenase family protein [Candidatus Eisenbacteria bacterium]